MKIALYARISTQNGRQDTENQLQPLREWAQRLGGTIVREYIDQASGAKADRKALQELFVASHRREFDTLLIWALDRLSREGIAKMTTHLAKLRQSGIRVMSLQESWLDTAGPLADLLSAVFSWVAQQERSRLQERILAGLERAKKQGKVFGRPRVFVNIAKANSLKTQGKSIRDIAQALGIKKATLARALSQNHPVGIAT